MSKRKKDQQYYKDQIDKLIFDTLLKKTFKENAELLDRLANYDERKEIKK